MRKGVDGRAVIYTSNFRTAGNHPAAIAISRGIPKWFKGRRYLPLAPSWSLINTTDPPTFTALYHEQVLSRLDPKTVLQELGHNPILLCWEKPGDFCHRIVVAEWLRSSAGVEVRELSQATLPKGKE